MEYEIALTPRARQDLDSIWRHLREQAPEEATQFCHRLVEHTFRLKTFPEGYPRLGHNRNVHQLTVRDYSIVYGVDKQKHLVKIFRFWHGAQSPRRFRLQESSPVYSPPSVIQSSL